MESREARMLVNRSGGTAGKGGMTFRVTLPTAWIRKMGLDEDTRDLVLDFDNEKITIKKLKIINKRVDFIRNE